MDVSAACGIGRASRSIDPFMQKFIIQGGKPLKGEIRVAGEKNTALVLIPACVLIPGKTTLSNLPLIQDVDVMLSLVKKIGCTVERSADGREATIDASTITNSELPTELVTKVRASALFAAPLLSRTGAAKLHHPGGDVIGRRPLDMLVDGLAELGVTVKQTDRFYDMSAKKINGGAFVFRRVTVTVTENLLLAAVCSKGTTKLINAALEPSVQALCRFLVRRGARISGIGSPFLTVEGVQKLKAVSEPFYIDADRDEAATFACLAAASDSEVLISDCRPDHMEVFLKIISLMGVSFDRDDHSIKIKKHHGKIRAVEVVTHEYPGFSSDVQAPMTVLLTQAKGVSLVHETMYDGRLFYTDKLKQMGAKIIMADPHRAIVEGPSTLRGRKIISPDIRAGIGLVIAGLIAEGTTTIGNIYQIDRGYEAIDERLAALGADMKRVETDYF
jgi:UDP-N-acetylglucosamine 1-carboxyvinyltransferase